MNQKTIDFYNQALKKLDPKDVEGSYVEAVVCRVAELVRQDERTQCAADYLDDCARAVEAARLEERDACAKLCEEWAKEAWDQEGGALNCADKIRGRTE
jgi:hypothetical protein